MEVLEATRKDAWKAIKPKFRDPDEMTVEELTDPDYRLKQLAKLKGDGSVMTCSKCHHCR